MSKFHVALVGLVFTVLTACGDYEIQLRRGYILGRTSSETFVVVDPSRHVIVGPTVDRCRVEGDLFIGRVSTRGDQHSFFIVDMRTGNIQRGLRETEWRRQLTASGVTDYRLIRPTRFVKSLEKQR